MRRSWGGVGLILAGAVLAGHRIERTRCSGFGAATPGVLLATVWSDVPVARSVDVSATPGGFRIGKTFAF